MVEERSELRTVWAVTNYQLAAANEGPRARRLHEEKKHGKEHMRERKMVEQRDDFVRWEDGFDGERWCTISRFYLKITTWQRIKRWLTK